jgi:hypothetical protein
MNYVYKKEVQNTLESTHETLGRQRSNAYISGKCL